MAKPKTGSLSFNKKLLVDVAKNIDFTVTPKQSKEGKGLNACECPGALGFLATGKLDGKDCVYVEFHRSVIYMDFGGKYSYRGRPSAPLRTEIIAQDRHGNFAPGQYQVQPISKSQRDKRGKRHSDPTLKHGRPGHHRSKPIRFYRPIKHIRDLAMSSTKLERI